MPEDRLPPMIVGAAALPIGLFWFALSSSPLINPWPQILAGVPIGIGVQVILLQSLAYLIDIYTTRAASAISGTMIVRSLVGGTFPLFALEIYGKLGVCILFYSHVTGVANRSNRYSGLRTCWGFVRSPLRPYRSSSCSLAEGSGIWGGTAIK
jgi:hypothetical protein